ncbi:MAG: hypothetical protein F6K18_26945 [Okeania sp. SIO2C2]|uniref:hypothetical protein n=1 Tax=Okeania sp. SIO2C2 TaxID=2607787 RepID=UPI0013BC87E9|nr:hypothetical protein [Okeania sp. SIO2C2]NEP90167.1 hypothetical protein [Okeania sp. SIO2C2]
MSEIFRKKIKFITVLRSDSRDVQLPLNTLDETKPVVDSTPIPQGSISEVKRGKEDQVQITTDASKLKSRDVVKISKTKSYDGHYVATKIDYESILPSLFSSNQNDFTDPSKLFETA